MRIAILLKLPCRSNQSNINAQFNEANHPRLRRLARLFPPEITGFSVILFHCTTMYHVLPWAARKHKEFKGNPLFMDSATSMTHATPIHKKIYKKYRALRAKLIDTHTVHYPENWAQSSASQFLRTCRYKMLSKGHPLTQNEKNILKYKRQGL